jgi:hypothetical protein
VPLLVVRVLVIVIFARVPAFPQGGPPLLTDDPETPGPGNWEINVASMLVTTEQQAEVQAPLLDINYGVGDRIQLKYQVPYLFDRDAGSLYRGGPGNSLLGVKWRFFQQQDTAGWRISTYPQLELNNPGDSYARGLVDAGPRFLLPVEITKGLGPLGFNFEGGYWFARKAPDVRILGLAIGHQFTPKFQGLTEVYDQAELGGQSRATTWDMGGRLQIKEGLLLLFMAGRRLGNVGGVVAGEPAFMTYVGLQFQLK